MNNKTPLVWIEKGYICIYADPHRYDIEQSQFDDWRTAIAWINHLSEKSWFTVNHLRALLSVINAPFLG